MCHTPRIHGKYLHTDDDPHEAEGCGQGIEGVSRNQITSNQVKSNQIKLHQTKLNKTY